MCFRKKTNKEKILACTEAMKDNLKEFDVLIAFAESNEAVRAKLEEVKDKYKYLSPKADKETSENDKKVAAKLGDIKILLSKTGKNRDEEILAELTLITRIMAER